MPLFGFGNVSCKWNTTLSTKKCMSVLSAPRTNSSQSWVKPSGVRLFLTDASWPISNMTFTYCNDNNDNNQKKYIRWMRVRNERIQRHRPICSTVIDHRVYIHTHHSTLIICQWRQTKYMTSHRVGFTLIGRQSGTHNAVACRARETRCGDNAGGEEWTFILTGNAIFMGSSLPYGGWFFWKLLQRTVFVDTHEMQLASGSSLLSNDNGRAVCFDFCQFTLRYRAKIQTMDERVQDNRRNIIYFPNKNTIPLHART